MFDVLKTRVRMDGHAMKIQIQIQIQVSPRSGLGLDERTASVGCQVAKTTPGMGGQKHFVVYLWGGCRCDVGDVAKGFTVSLL